MANRVAAMIATLRPRVDALTSERRASLDKDMAVDFQEHFSYQQLQAHAHAAGLLTPDEAMIVYRSLGEVGSTKNGGWAAGTDLATKVAVTKLMGELLERQHRPGGRFRSRADHLHVGRILTAPRSSSLLGRTGDRTARRRGAR